MFTHSDRCAADVKDLAILDDVSESGQGGATPATVGYRARIDCAARHYLLRGIQMTFLREQNTAMN